MSARRSLEGQVAVVTGAARGVGELLARKLSARGAKVALVGLEPEALKEVSERLHTESDHWHADVTDHEAMARVAQEVKQRFGKVDIVVANAGVAAGGPFVDSDPDAWRRVIEVNLIGGAVTARAFLPVLMESRGYFLQIASLAAITPAPMMTAYCASKSGVEAFAHCLRAEVGYKGVKVGVGYLSWTDTDMVRGADQDEVMRELRQRLPWPSNRTYPLGRPSTGSWPASSGARRTCTRSGGCGGCRACAATCRGSSRPSDSARWRGSNRGSAASPRGSSERAGPRTNRDAARPADPAEGGGGVDPDRTSVVKCPKCTLNDRVEVWSHVYQAAVPGQGERTRTQGREGPGSEGRGEGRAGGPDAGGGTGPGRQTP